VAGFFMRCGMMSDAMTECDQGHILTTIATFGIVAVSAVLYYGFDNPVLHPLMYSAVAANSVFVLWSNRKSN
jgi:hypothetical protein